MLIGGILWALLGLAMWADFVSSNWPKHPMEWLCDLTIALPFAILFGPVMFMLKVLK